MSEPHYPRVRVAGKPYDRGVAYGRAARSRIYRSKQVYEAAFRSAADCDWEQARATARTMRAAVDRAYPELIEEMTGIANGAELDFDDVLIMNCRTEILWAAKARAAAGRPVRGECSSFGLLPWRTASGTTLVGQNWDWLDHGRDTVVVLEVEPDEGPNFVTVVEAGLLAKASLNSSGLAVATNALVTSGDRGEPGVPYHVLLRALASCHTVSDAVAAVHAHVRASSANYLLGHADGLLVNLEAAAGDHRGVRAILPRDGALWHTNHFVDGPPVDDEVSVFAMPDTLTRYQRIETSIGRAAAPATIESLQAALADHADWPNSVCCHPDLRDPEPERWSTVMAVVMAPAQRQLWLAAGTPCETTLEPLDLGDLLSRPAPLGAAASTNATATSKEAV